ncbi:MAG: hypothetical protein ACSHX8_04640 [Opitutaceae bacterium]
MKSFILSSLSLLCLTSIALSAAPLKRSDLPQWQAGVEGGIPSYPVRVELTAEALTSDADQAIQSAIETVESPGVVLLPAGVFNITRPILLRSGVVLRGSGALDTKLIFDIPLFEEDDEGIRPALGFLRLSGVQTDAPVAINQAINKGDLSLSLAQPAALSVGDMILVDSENDVKRMYTEARWERPWAARSLGQIVNVVATEGSTVTVDTALRHAHKLDLNPQITRIEPITGAGLENLVFYRNEGALDNLVGFQFAKNCWILNCESENASRSHVWINFSRFVTVSGNRCHGASDFGGGGNGYGIVAGNVATDCLFENNIMHTLRHSIMAKRGSNGNVFAYNYSFDRRREEGKRLLCDISIHGHYPYQNLFEGNKVQFIELADYWGPSGPFNTFFRNHVADEIEISDHSHETVVWHNTMPKGRVKDDGTSVDLYIQNNGPAPVDEGAPDSLFYTEKPAYWGDAAWPVGATDAPWNPAEKRAIESGVEGLK